MIPVRDWDHVKPVLIAPGFQARFIHSANMTFALWEIEPEAALPVHSHPHEQVSQVMEGEFELTMEGTATLLRPGSMVVIPANTGHSGRALTSCKILDVFWPIREDYLSELNIYEANSIA